MASSAELKEDREQVEIWINRQNKKLFASGVFLELNLWEDFLDAMSQTRLQDEYNKTINECDIFISLFKTKVGKYTEEEFDVAYETFKANGKTQYLYTYFKKFQLNSDEIELDDLTSLKSFKAKLSDLGHFPTSVKNSDDLLRKSETINSIKYLRRWA